MIDLNVTLVIQLINFLVTLCLVNVLLIRPIRGAIQRRKEARDGLNAEIQTLVARVGSELGEYEEKLRAVRKQAADLIRVAREQGQAEQVNAIDVAGEQAGTIIREGHERSNQAADQTRRDLAREIPHIADEVVRRLLA